MTALLAADAQAQFEALRRAHFPPERNLVPAHVTLFHNLPGSELAGVRRRLAQVTDASPPDVEVAGIGFTGRGVAYRLRAPALDAVRAELAEGWHGLLTAQDQAGFRPHLTVQNKAAPEVAKATFAALSGEFAPWRTRVVALALWRYLDGPWEALGTWRFRGASGRS